MSSTKEQLPKQEVDFDDLRRSLANDFNALVRVIRNGDFYIEEGYAEIGIMPLQEKLQELRLRILFICGLQAEGLFGHVLDGDFHLADVSVQNDDDDDEEPPPRGPSIL